MECPKCKFDIEPYNLDENLCPECGTKFIPCFWEDKFFGYLVDVTQDWVDIAKGKPKTCLVGRRWRLGDRVLQYRGRCTGRRYRAPAD